LQKALEVGGVAPRPHHEPVDDLQGVAVNTCSTP